MANISFYTKKFGITTETMAFEKFVGTLQNYYDADFYVDWDKAVANAKRFEREFNLLNTIHAAPDKNKATRDLIRAHPEVVAALPSLMAWRASVSLLIDPDKAEVADYTFSQFDPGGREALAERYASFMSESGITDILTQVDHVLDYAIGVEVGLDSNGRKNRGGECGTRAVEPIVDQAKLNIDGLKAKPEASYSFLTSKGFCVPTDLMGIDWDYAFWIGDVPKRLAVMEINHYGSTGSKPPAIAREYSARQKTLTDAGIGFIWVTDGLGWRAMKNPLHAAFSVIDYLLNIKLSTEGQLEDALRTLLA